MRQRPDFGLMMHDDGDSTFQDATPGGSEAKIRRDMELLLATPVKTLSYCIGTGVMFYPTRVGSAIGWRSTPFDTQPAWSRIDMARAGLARGEDPIFVAGKTFRDAGRLFLLSHRINDSHFMKRPSEYPLVPRFWLDNQDLVIGTDRSPVVSEPDYGNLLDFTHKAVRKYNRDLMVEAAERYADVIDGLEIDFVRDQFLFPRGMGERRAHLITEMVAEVRAELDRLADAAGRPFYLVVRVPPTLQSATWAGLDVQTWAERGLVDAVVPAQLMTLAHEQPVDEFAAILEGTGVKLHPAIYSRTSYGWELERTPPRAYVGDEKANVTASVAAGAAANFYAMGADGVQLYNWASRTWIGQPWFKDIATQVATPQSGRGLDASFAVTPSFYLDLENTYEARKTLPQPLNPTVPTKVQIFVGADLQDDPAKAVVLRLGFGRPTEQRAPTVDLAWNGRRVFAGPVGTRLIATPVSPGGKAAKAPLRYAPPFSYFQIELPPGSLKRGWNEIDVTSTASASLTEVRLKLYRR